MSKLDRSEPAAPAVVAPFERPVGRPVPFKPETWPVDADGFAPDLCTECGTPVRYGSRHTDCGRKAMGLPPVERTVASIPDADLLRRVVRHVAQRRPKRKEFAWAAVSEAFGLGSTFSTQLLRRFGLDPDTGAELKTPNVRGNRRRGGSAGMRGCASPTRSAQTVESKDD